MSNHPAGVALCNFANKEVIDIVSASCNDANEQADMNGKCVLLCAGEALCSLKRCKAPVD